MLVPYFAPQSHAAVFRAHKFAKYLPEFGFKPVVVTVDTNYLYNEDRNLLDEFPSEVEIHRARYIEPTIRGIRMAIGGADRSFATLKAAGRIEIARSAGDPNQVVSTKPHGRGVGAVAAKWIGKYPDRYWTWSGSAYRLAARLVEQHDIQLLYTSSKPVSFLRAALKLQKRNGVAWLLDARDPLGYGQKNNADHAIALLQERRILQRSMFSADHVTGLASAYGQIFFDLYGLPEQRFDFIPTGLDEAYILEPQYTKRDNFILHVGEVMRDQRSYTFEMLEQALEQSGGQSFSRLIFVGRQEVNEPRIRRLTSGLPKVQQRLEFIDHCAQADVYNLIRRARACVLAPGPSRYWWNNFAKMVDYIALGVPVIADVPEISEARTELERAGTGFFLTGEVDIDAAALNGWLPGTETIFVSDYAKRYTARRQVSDLAAILHRLYEDTERRKNG